MTYSCDIDTVKGRENLGTAIAALWNAATVTTHHETMVSMVSPDTFEIMIVYE